MARNESVRSLASAVIMRHHTTWFPFNCAIFEQLVQINKHYVTYDHMCGLALLAQHSIH